MIRLRIVNYIIAAMFVFLGLGLFNLELIQGKNYKNQSDKNCIRLLPQWGARGLITDRAGNLLVGNKLSYDALVMPLSGAQRSQILREVARILGKDQSDLIAAYKLNFIGPSLPVLVASSISREQAIALEELKNDDPAIVVQSRPVRFYPYAGLASHLTGYLAQIDRWRLTKLEDYGYKTKDIVGFGGIEEKYDYFLRQEEGGLSFEVDHKGKFVRALGFKPPTNGKNLQLTIDLRIQKAVETALAGKKGAAVMMDPFTGEIQAMVSQPGFDPGLFTAGMGSPVSGLFSDPDAPLVNRAISSAYPPGSIYKVVVAAAGLENEKIAPSTTFVCQGSAMIGRQRFDCSKTHGAQQLTQALAHSCNVFFYRTGLLLGAQSIHDWSGRFGLSRAAGIDLPYEIDGFIPSPRWRKIDKFKSWFNGDTANLSIGQGECLVTPLQAARMMAVIANRGYLVRPYVVKAIDAGELSVSQKKSAALNLKSGTIEQIREGLRDVVRLQDGTANMLSVLPVEVAGKTGTAQAPPGRSHGWFCGFFPFDKPKYVICVFLERGGSGAQAASVAKEIISSMVSEGIV